MQKDRRVQWKVKDYIYYKTCRGIFLRVQQNLLLQSCWVFAHFAPKLSENRILKRRNDATKADTKIILMNNERKKMLM